MSDVERVKDALRNPRPRKPVVAPEDYVSTGCTVLNLAVSGREHGGFAKGTYVYFVGESESGKTWFTFNTFMEAAKNPSFKDHQFVFDNAENGAMMDVVSYFGPEVYKRVRPPARTRGRPVNSSTVREFYYHVDDALDGGPCLYVLDSMDALDTEEDAEKFGEEKEASRNGRAVSGSYGMAKAKTNSQNIKRVTHRLEKTGSILIVISQMRDKVNSPIPNQKTWSGGKAFRYYASVQLLTAAIGPIRKTVKGKPRIIGSNIQIEAYKNRLTGWHGKVYVPFYRRHGLHDVQSCVDYLIAEGHWKKRKGGIAAKEFDFVGRKFDLIEKIYRDDAVRELQALVGNVWREIDSECEVPWRSNH